MQAFRDGAITHAEQLARLIALVAWAFWASRPLQGSHKAHSRCRSTCEKRRRGLLAQLKLDLPIEPKPATQQKGARFSLRARWTSTT